MYYCLLLEERIFNEYNWEFFRCKKLWVARNLLFSAYKAFGKQRHAAILRLGGEGIDNNNAAAEGRTLVNIIKFERLNTNKVSVQITNINVYNTQFKVAVLLINMWRFIEKNNVEVEHHHMLWYNNDSEFPTKINRIIYVFLDKTKNDKNYKEIINLQEKYRNMSLIIMI